MRTDAPAAPRAPEPNPRRLPATASPAATHSPSATASKPQTDAFSALLQAADDSLAGPPSAQGDADLVTAPSHVTGDAQPDSPLQPNPLDPSSRLTRFDARVDTALSSGTATPSGAAGSEAAPGSKAASAAAQPSTTGHWVSTVAKARAKPTHLAASPAAAELAPGPAGQASLYPRPAAALAPNPYAAGAGAAAGSASAAAQGIADESDAGALLAALTAGARGESSAREGSGQGARGGDAARTLVESPTASGTGTEAAKADADFSHLLEQATAQGLDAVWEPLGQQISFWLAGQVKRANLLLHEGLHQTLEIEIKLDGQQAQLDFLTNDEQLRESLRSQAQEALSELLGQNGLELAGLSIGSRASGQSDRSTAQRPQASSARAEVTETPAAEPPSLVLQPASGRAGLSVYA
ncbi:flagellar hook-length control protein FliK [Serpentinimonas barnesii]|uniref:flagellar hook-length control protein FliK n=1 Tax=Serpentinimonas barnesii TaxID=1458427 RepID=UPI0011EA6BF8|nr:flagellar hook-length control protein FliK [Serpentinimonas barnesii]